MRDDAEESLHHVLRECVRLGYIADISRYRYRVTPRGVQAMQSGTFRFLGETDVSSDCQTSERMAATGDIIVMEFGGENYQLLAGRERRERRL